MSLMTKSTVTKGGEKVKAGAMKARSQARRAQQAAAQVAPLATSARMTTRQGVHNARTWTAPRLERTGQAIETRVAPRMSAMLSDAARRIQPSQPKRRRWPFLTAGLVAVAATAAAAVMRSRRGSGSLSPLGKSSSDTQTPETAQDAAATSSSDANGRVHTR